MPSTQLVKLEHSSILLKYKGKKILFDPGNFSKQNENLYGIDILIITHSHGDHLNMDNIQYVNEHAEGLQIVTNSGVAEAIKELGIVTHIVEGRDSLQIDGIDITAHDNPHEEIFKDFGLVQNTGYYVDDVFFHPGDSFTTPNKSVKAIATVIIAPFMRVKMAIDYINKNPDVIHLGVHDGVANPELAGLLKNIIEKNIDEGITYVHPDSDPVNL